MTVFVCVSLSRTPPTLYSSQPLNLLSNLHPFSLSRPQCCDPPRLKITIFLVPLPRLLYAYLFSLSLTSIHIPGYSCNKSLCCNFALLKARNDGAQRKTKVGGEIGVGDGGGTLLFSAQKESLSWGFFFFFFFNEPPGGRGRNWTDQTEKEKEKGANQVTLPFLYQM